MFLPFSFQSTAIRFTAPLYMLLLPYTFYCSPIQFIVPPNMIPKQEGLSQNVPASFFLVDTYTLYCSPIHVIALLYFLLLSYTFDCAATIPKQAIESQTEVAKTRGFAIDRNFASRPRYDEVTRACVRSRTGVPPGLLGGGRVSGWHVDNFDDM